MGVSGFGAPTGWLEAAARCVMPLTTKRVEEFVTHSWLFTAYLFTFAAVGLTFVGYGLIAAYNMVFQSTFSLPRSPLCMAHV